MTTTVKINNLNNTSVLFGSTFIGRPKPPSQLRASTTPSVIFRKRRIRLYRTTEALPANAGPNNTHCHFDRSPTAFSGRTQWRNLKLSKNSSTTSFGLALTGFARNDKKDSSEILAYAGMKNLILIVICHSCESRNPFHYGVISN